MKSPRLKYALCWAVLPVLGQLFIDAKNQYVLHHVIHPLSLVAALWPYDLLITSAFTFALAYAFYPVFAFLRDYNSLPRAAEIRAAQSGPDAQNRTPPAG